MGKSEASGASAPDESRLALILLDARRFLRPPEELTVSEWAERSIVLGSESSDVAGTFRPYPWQREIMDSACVPGVRKIVLRSAAQVGKTAVLLAILGYHIERRPSPMLYVAGTIKLAEAISKDRLKPMIDRSPTLRDLVHPARSRDAENTILHKTFPGGHVTLGGTNSPISLSSRPVRLVFLDECDRYEQSARQEGDPVALAEQRTEAFRAPLHVLASSPTFEGLSVIQREWEDSDQRLYVLPCPGCGAMLPLTWSAEAGRDSLWVTWQTDPHEPKTARFQCTRCRRDVGDADRFRLLMSGRGEWRPTFPERTETRGYHVWRAHVATKRLSVIVADFLKKKRRREALIVWVNTTLGEVFREPGARALSPDDLFVRLRVRPWAKLPADVLYLVAGADVQGDRIEVEVVGWSENLSSWGVAYRVLWGPPDAPEVWASLDELLGSSWEHESGYRLKIAAACVDSGSYTQHVYDYVRPRFQRGVWAIKGKGGAGIPLVSAPTRRRTGRERRAFPLFSVGTDEAYQTLFDRLALDPGEPRSCTYPASPDYPLEYFTQLVSMQARVIFSRGRMRREWVAVPGRPRHEALDCRTYALAAISIASPPWRALRRRLATGADAPAAPPRPRRRRLVALKNPRSFP